MLECVVNISEGRDPEVLAALTEAAGPLLLDLHSDPDHHRSVLTLLGEDAPRAVAEVAVARLDLRDHAGAHPRLGVVDVVPFVPLDGATMADAVAARDAFAAWIVDALGVPCFCYGAERSLPEVRRRAFTNLRPDVGPSAPHPTAGAVCVGARPVLVAYNVWLATPDHLLAQHVAAALRGPDLRALGLVVGDRAQVSMNLVAPLRFGPAEAFDAVVHLVGREQVAEAELVGLLPEAVLGRVQADRWAELDLGPERTIEWRRATRS